MRKYVRAVALLFISNALCGYQSSMSVNSANATEQTPLLIQIVDPESLHSAQSTSYLTEKIELLDWKKPTATTLSFALLLASSLYFPDKCINHSSCTYIQAAARASLPAEVIITFCAGVLTVISFFQRCAHFYTQRNSTLNSLHNIPLVPPPAL
jgi:hypothetical protein